MKLSELRKQISEYMKQGLVMEDLRESAEKCQERIEWANSEIDRLREIERLAGELVEYINCDDLLHCDPDLARYTTTLKSKIEEGKP